MTGAKPLQVQVDVVVVYKIDRLTRSLADFSRIIEIFEKAGTSFVSVTQSFNTTNSMGRLMLNVLLSFAQFEREVTGERIRDKIAASKVKGMWMGGNLPLGYDLPEAGTRKLRVNEAEAATVRRIFARYLELGSVHALQRELEEQGTRSKLRITATGKTSGGGAFSRGALFHLLRNRIYLGRIVHREQSFEGEHDAIVDEELFDQVQRQLDGNARRHHAAADHRIIKAPLTGKLFDASGEPMSPTFSRGKSGRAYRYYVSVSLQQGFARKENGRDEHVRRISAPALEKLVMQLIERWFGPEETFGTITSLRFSERGLLVDLPVRHAADLAAQLGPGERILHADRKNVRVEVRVTLPLRGGQRLVCAGDRREPQVDPTLVAALRRAHQMISRERGLPLVEVAPASQYDRRILRLAFLAPDLQRDILAGRQPADLSLERLRSIAIPLGWNEQRQVLGWPS
ncbi:recombinase family protein [Altererythrobacter sp. SALINAS58]|nr:recombinase family protein [Alteripontixanthobacter muriae]